MNLRRTGVLKNRLRTSIVVPGGELHGVIGDNCPPTTSNSAPAFSSGGRDRSVNRLTSAIEASASPRKPIVAT